jgi:hypothetical protein
VLAPMFAAGAMAHPDPSSDPASGPLARGAANPILRNNSSYDDLKAGPSAVVKVATGDYRQWYEALDAENVPRGGDVLSQTAYATSADGSSWTKRGIVFAPFAAPSWENSEACPTSMHWDGSQWILFYHGGNNSAPRAIGRATSPTGTSDFTRSGGPVLERGAPGSWDSKFVADAKAIAPWEGPDELWRLYYVGRNDAGQGQVGLATSVDGVSFTKVGSSPVLAVGPQGAWDDSDIQAFTPEWDARLGLFRAWYVAGGAVGYAWSDDGLSWSRGERNPVLSSIPGDSIQDSIDSYLDGSVYRLIYGQYDLAATPPLRGKGEAKSAASEPVPVPVPVPEPEPEPEPVPVPEPTQPVPPAATTAAFSVSSSGDDGDLERGGPAYPPASATPTLTETGAPILLVRRSTTPWPYVPVRVSLLRFDTSALPDDAIVTSAVLQLYTTGKSSTDNRSLRAEWYTATHWPLDAGDWSVADQGSAHSGTSLDAIETGRQVSLALQSLGGIDTRGATGIRMHVSGSDTAPSGPNEIAFAASESPTLPAPTLIVQYERAG